MPKSTPTSFLHKLYGSMEKKSKFRLSHDEVELLKEIEDLIGVKVKAWSFIVHPKVLDRLFSPIERPNRYIIIIETLRAKLYWAVRSFLDNHKININSYYTGGSADFLCDAMLTDAARNEFYEGLKHALIKDGGGKLKGNVEDYISEFMVDGYIILCHKPLKELGVPSESSINEIKKQREVFEEALRDYSSKDFLRLMHNDQRKAEAFINRLHRNHIIVGFKPIFDVSSYIDKEYVPISKLQSEALANIYDKQAEVLGPVQELLKVRATKPADEVDKEVTHIFINHYGFPLHRQRWKEIIYKEGPDEVNTFSYPLEGTLHESSTVLSDLPQKVKIASKYHGNDSIRVGCVDAGNYALDDLPINMPISCVRWHGVTIGAPGSGKTNSDLQIILGMMRYLNTIIVLDRTNSIKSKIDGMKDKDKLLKQLYIENITDEAHVEERLTKAISAKGIIILGGPITVMRECLRILTDYIQKSDDCVKGNIPRRINNLIFIEEAYELLADFAPGFASIANIINQGYRKGWALWLSTQYASQLGRNQEEAIKIVSSMQNKIIHRIDNNNEIDLIYKVLDNCRLTPIGFRNPKIHELRIGSAWVTFQRADGETPDPLPIIPARIKIIK